MNWLRYLVLYTALGLGANAALAQGAPENARQSAPATGGAGDTGNVQASARPVADIPTLEALRDGQMKKLMFAAEPAPVSDVPFEAEDGSERRLSDYGGKYVLVNFWATWCAPCRKEMPSLEALQTEFQNDNFEVVTIATGRNTRPGIKKFFAEIGVENLPQNMDKKSALAREMGVLGLPITVLLNPQGQEIARLRGDAEWDTESARAIASALSGKAG
ncbi:TlpA disulfide reductase family protein [Brevirhabdus sp.]|uniref:TlpA disulfide reductase family protein n=1 Tax=Brevirhabdus sp. TaxID=2004514 RepID=UPI00405A2F1D